MTIVVDENIPYAREAFGSLGDVRLLPGRAIVRAELGDADALIVRSITRVDAALLEGTPVRFVGTATNGLDHIDGGYLMGRGIELADIGGANAEAVSEYVVAALLELRDRGLLGFDGGTIGVVGMGKIGGRVAEDARLLGLGVVEYDPPREECDPLFTSAGLDELFACDLISLHVPYMADGDHPTRHFIDATFLGHLRPGTILLNTARGAVADSSALVAAVDSGRLGALVLDVWEGEPSIPAELITRCALATPHIASYSIDAKGKGTDVMVHALADFLGKESSWTTRLVLPDLEGRIAIPRGTGPLDALALAVRSACDIVRDDTALRSLLEASEEERGSGFDRLRKNYPRRREFHAYAVESDDPAVLAFLVSLGFRG